MRFETLLGVLALIPCLIVLGFGLPKIELEPLLSTEYTPLHAQPSSM